MPVVWSDRCLLHEPAAEIWVATPTPAAELPQEQVVPYVSAHRQLGARRAPAAVWAKPGWFAYDTMTLVRPGTWEAARAARRDPRERMRPQILKGEAPDAVRISPGCRFHPRCPEALPECRDVDPDLRSAGADHCAACILVS